MVGLRTKYGAISVELRLGITLRMLGGGSYHDLEQNYGLPAVTLYSCLWDVVDAINTTAEVGPCLFPQTSEECAAFAAKFKVMFKEASISVPLWKPVYTSACYLACIHSLLAYVKIIYMREHLVLHCQMTLPARMRRMLVW